MANLNTAKKTSAETKAALKAEADAAADAGETQVVENGVTYRVTEGIGGLLVKTAIA